MQHSRTRPHREVLAFRPTGSGRVMVTDRVDRRAGPVLACARATGHGFARARQAALTMLLVALTGNIASGKSSVARLLVARGATLIDADLLARLAVRVGTP